MSGFSTQDIINLSNESHAEGLAEGAALRDELAEALRASAQFVETENFPIGWSLERLLETLSKYEASKS